MLYVYCQLYGWMRVCVALYDSIRFCNENANNKAIFVAVVVDILRNIRSVLQFLE